MYSRVILEQRTSLFMDAELEKKTCFYSLHGWNAIFFYSFLDAELHIVENIRLHGCRASVENMPLHGWNAISFYIFLLGCRAIVENIPLHGCRAE